MLCFVPVEVFLNIVFQQNPSPLLCVLVLSLNIHPSVKVSFFPSVFFCLFQEKLKFKDTIFFFFFKDNTRRCQITEYTRTDMHTIRNTRKLGFDVIIFISKFQEGADSHIMHIETGGLSRRPKQQHRKVRSLMGVKGSVSAGGGGGRVGLDGLSCSNVSDPPKQKMVGAVVPSDCFTAIGQSEVLVAVATGDD